MLRTGSLMRVMNPLKLWMIDLTKLNVHTIPIFAVLPYDWRSWQVPIDQRSTDKPAVPRYLLSSLRPDLRTVLARFRFSAHNLLVVRGRYAGESFFHRVCRLTEADECQLVQDEHHKVFACKHPAICGLRAYFDIYSMNMPGLVRLLSNYVCYKPARCG